MNENGKSNKKNSGNESNSNSNGEIPLQRKVKKRNLMRETEVTVAASMDPDNMLFY
jgi:hypothetical protein